MYDETRELRNKIRDLELESKIWYEHFISESQKNDKNLTSLWGVESVLLLKEGIPQLLICRLTRRLAAESGKCPVHNDTECLDLYIKHEELVEAIDKFLHPKEL